MTMLKRIFLLCAVCAFGFALGYKTHKKNYFKKITNFSFQVSRKVNSDQTRNKPCHHYQIRSYKKNTWKQNSDGSLYKTRDGQFLHDRRTYFSNRPISSCDSAVVVMDAWVGLEEKIQNYKKEMKDIDPLEDRVIPVVKKAEKLGLKIVILTNESMKDTPFIDVHPYLRGLINQGRASVFFHERTSTDAFSDILKEEGIKNLFYVGFAAEKCILFRRMGLAHMHHKPFRLFYIPEASAADNPITDLGEPPIDLLKAVTQIVSEQCCEIVSYKDFMNLKG